MYGYTPMWTSVEEVILETKAIFTDATVVVSSHGERYQLWDVF